MRQETSSDAGWADGTTGGDCTELFFFLACLGMECFELHAFLLLTGKRRRSCAGPAFDAKVALGHSGAYL